MMRFIRNNAVFVLVVVVFIVAVFIGTIFLVWGRGSMSSSTSERSIAAWVGKEEIPYAEFVKTYDSRLDFYRRFYPNIGAAELEKRFKVRKGALDAAISRRLLLDEARRLGLTATDEEVGRRIRETASFQENGAFDPKKYRELLAASGLTPALYEEDVRGELLAGKVRTVVQEPVRVSEAEAYEEFRRDKEKVRLALVILPAPAPVPGVAVAPERLRRAFDADPAKYTLPERAQFACAAVLARDVPPPPAAGEDALRRYFEENPVEFRIDRRAVQSLCGKDTIVMHPLPRDGTPGSNDLATDLDDDPRLAIFRQTDAGIPVRMAVFAVLLGVEGRIAASLRDATWISPPRIGTGDAPFHRLA
jgi:aspartate carbamoyltransferase catalytic subunit